jgi:hypothetical protein
MKKQRKTLELSKGEFPKRFKICHKTVVKRGPTKIKTKCVRFGDRRYGNYTTHKNPKRKANYISRHRKRENWKDMGTPGFWAKNLLWNKPSLSASIKDVERRKGIRIVRKS